MNSAPGRTERLTSDAICAAIDSLNTERRLVTVIFAGGEPLLLGDELLEAIAHATECGMNTRVVTNAYWAVTPARAQAKLVELREAGLREVNISADDFHLPFVPFSRVENAWHASKGLGFSSVVIANSSGPGSSVTPRFISERLGEDLEKLWGADGRLRNLPPRNADGTVYCISNASLQRLGRAHIDLTEDRFKHGVDQQDIDVPCRWAVRSAALSPKGHLLSCCGFEVEGNELLDFGDTSKVDPRVLAENADRDVIVNAIALLGPVFLKSFLQKRAPEISFRSEYGSMCEVCEHIVTRPEAVRALRDHTPALAGYVLDRREALQDLEATGVVL